MQTLLRDYRDLDVWNVSKEMAVKAYELARGFPAFETYGLADQVRRAASSIPANIAEGSGRGTRRELLRFLRIARGSLAELDSHLGLAIAVGYCGTDTSIVAQIERVRRMLNALIGALHRSKRNEA